MTNEQKRDSLFEIIHHQNMAQGEAVLRVRYWHKDVRVGTVLSIEPVYAASASSEDQHAAAVWDALTNRSTLNLLLQRKGEQSKKYPDILMPYIERIMKEGDLKVATQSMDILGVNYYSGQHIQYDPEGMFGAKYADLPSVDGHTLVRTGMGWPVEPEGIYRAALDLRDNYGNPTVYITENGAAFPDVVDSKGHVNDQNRIKFIRDHLKSVHRAISLGCNVKRYYCWTLLDNFEWSEGYTQHFGLVRVDRKTMKRTPKASYYAYRNIVRTRGLGV